MSEAALFEESEELPLEAEDATTETQEESSEQEKAAEVSTEKPAEPEKTVEDAPKQERVPLAALLDERRQRQGLEQELREQRESMGRLDERLKHIQEATQKTPSKDDDPVGYLEHENRQLQDRLKPLEDGQEAQRDHAEQQAVINDVSSRTQAFEAQFVAEHEDYHEAVDFLKDQATERYRIMGVTDPMQLQQLLHRDSLTLAKSAMDNGQDPAEIAYKMAQAGGFKKPNEADEKLANIQRGQKASSSLSGAGGEGTVPLTLEAIADMDDDDFGKISDSQWRKLVGST